MILATILLLIAVVIPFLATDTEWALEKCQLGAPETSHSENVGWSWWPYGTQCRLTTSDGRTRQQVVPPWSGAAEWPGR